jgi:hypothetical protein
LGETSLMLVDAQDCSLDFVSWILQGKDLKEGRGGGQINNSGVYRSVCVDINLRTKVCICALLHARYLSDMEGGELSKKLIRKVAGAGGDFLRNNEHTSEASVTSLESLVAMVQTLVDARDAKAKEIAALRHQWAGSNADAAADPDDDEAFLESMQDAGLYNAVLEGRLAELRQEHTQYTTLLNGLYGWLASPTSLFHDAALLRKVHQYMDRVMKLFFDLLRRNGCEIIYASYSRVLFATGKLRVVPDITHFWNTFCENTKAQKCLETLGLHIRSQDDMPSLYYGVMWLDPSNWAGVPINNQTGAVTWRAISDWKLAEFLPPALSKSILLYVAELLVVPQQEIERRYVQAMCGSDVVDEVAAVNEDAPMEVDGDGDCENDIAGGQCAAGGAEQQPGAMNVDADAAGANSIEKQKPPEDGNESSTRTDKIFEGIREFMQGEFFIGLRSRIIACIKDLQAQHQREAPAGHESSSRLGRLYVEEDGSDEEDDDNLDEDVVAERKQAREERHRAKKWSFPDLPGRRTPPAAFDVEFIRTLVQVFQLEAFLSEEVTNLRDELCKIINISSFSSEVTFENPCFPLFLRDVTCPRCCYASHVDVMSHPNAGPGLWVCPICEAYYEKDTMQALLVSSLESVVQAWQAQEIECQKCKRLRSTKLQKFCQCYGRFQLRLSADDFKLVISMLRSLVVPHQLPWLGEALAVYEAALP